MKLSGHHTTPEISAFTLLAIFLLLLCLRQGLLTYLGTQQFSLCSERWDSLVLMTFPEPQRLGLQSYHTDVYQAAGDLSQILMLMW